MTVHSFNERNRYAAATKARLVWEPFYRQAFPGFAALVEIPARRCTAQILGIDHVVVLTSGKEVRVDTKLRERPYSDDLLLEYRSDDDASKPGWIEQDLQIDYLAVVWEPSRRGVLLPWEQLRRAWHVSGVEWILKARHGIADPAPEYHRGADGFAHVVAANRENGKAWRTLSICVPMRVIANAVRDACFVEIPHENVEASIQRRPAAALPEQLVLHHTIRGNGKNRQQEGT